ncbi:MAG: 30S ribosomal protein S18 [Phycisphaerales bacterium]|jgi:small subunit ribosomal protein S18|nr:30S ribosomal protein S18 [Phycisphaerales bacterium]
MAAMRGNRRSRQIKIVRKDPKGNPWVDYKDVDDLRRLMTPNGKIYSRKRLGTNAAEQRRVSQAIKRARFMGLLPYTSGTL